MPDLKRYSYNGPVFEFDRCIAPSWIAETSAPSKEKAKSNLAFRFKRDNNKVKNAKITLPGEIVELEREESQAC